MSSQYRKGHRDATVLIDNYSLFMASHLIWAMGMGRKSKKDSNRNLYLYCEGMNDKLEDTALTKGLELKDGRVSQDDI